MFLRVGLVGLDLKIYHSDDKIFKKVHDINFNWYEIACESSCTKNGTKPIKFSPVEKKFSETGLANFKISHYKTNRRKWILYNKKIALRKNYERYEW